MKTQLLNTALFALLFTGSIFAQEVTTVRANSTDISDNLDLRAVASIFGESNDLEDFERRLNDPQIQISNLDLNGDNRVDYLRVVEASERNTHLIILQAVLGIDTFQDVATIEVEKTGNDIQVQIVGDVYMYGPNYIYEPVYIRRPAIYSVFWVSAYRPYYSPWYWGYYPSYYTYWAPYPVYRYRNHVHGCINYRNTYTYVNTRRSSHAVAMYNTRRSNAYERQHPENSFSRRNSNANNRYALEQNRESERTERAATSRSSFTNSSNRTGTASRSNTSINSSSRSTTTVRSSNDSPSRSTNTVRSSSPARNNSETMRSGSSNRENARTVPVVNRSSQPARQNTTQRSSTAPTMRSSAPSQRSTPSVRTSPSPQRQSAPSRSSRSASGNSRG